MGACRGDLGSDNRRLCRPAGGGWRRRRSGLPRGLLAQEGWPGRRPAGGGSEGQETGGEEVRGEEAAAARVLPWLLPLPAGATDGHLRRAAGCLLHHVILDGNLVRSMRRKIL